MGSRGRVLRRVASVLASSALVAGANAQAATAIRDQPAGSEARPTPITTPGGLIPGEVLPATTCIGVCIVKDTSRRSCTGYSSQLTPPATIRVLVHIPTIQVLTVPFETYVENVLPDEWVPSWDGDALKAGAVAVKSYAWYWVTHYGGYLNTSANCFDVTDDTSFPMYRANSASPRTTTAVQQSWPVVAREGGQVLQASYRADLNSPAEGCGVGATGATLSQYGTQNCVQANTGNKYNVILQKY